VNEQERIEAGRATYARNFGLTAAETEAAMTDRAGAAYTYEAYLAAGGPGWQGDRLTDRDRAVAVIAALVSQHVTDDRLTVYLNAARRNGITEEGLEALLILLTAYLGQPAPSVAMSTVRRSASGQREPATKSSGDR
jgi:4-carboxymuconolactone decarboxylase